MNKEKDYSTYFAIMAMWLMLGCLAQCESAGNLNDIRKELNGIKLELNAIKYK